MQRRDLALTMGVGFLAAFIVLAALLADGSVPQVDIDIARWVLGIDFWSWDSIVSVGEALTGSPLGVIVWFAAVALFWGSGRPVEAIVLALAGAIWVPKEIAVQIVERPRPLIGVDGFPSGVRPRNSIPSGGDTFVAMMEAAENRDSHHGTLAVHGARTLGRFKPERAVRTRCVVIRHVVGVQNLMRPTGTRDGGRLGRSADAVGHRGRDGSVCVPRFIKTVLADMG